MTALQIVHSIIPTSFFFYYPCFFSCKYCEYQLCIFPWLNWRGCDLCMKVIGLLRPMIFFKYLIIYNFLLKKQIFKMDHTFHIPASTIIKDIPLLCGSCYVFGGNGYCWLCCSHRVWQESTIHVPEIYQRVLFWTFFLWGNSTFFLEWKI